LRRRSSLGQRSNDHLDGEITCTNDYGVVEAAVDGRRSATGFDGYSSQVTRDDRVELGMFMLQPGRHSISLTVAGKNRGRRGFDRRPDYQRA